MMRWFPLLLLSCLATVATAQDDSETIAASEHPVRANSWTPSVVEAMAALPLQEGGRTKPLAALAASTLHLVHGRRDMKLDLDGDGKPEVTLMPTEWLLDVWCFPEQAATYPLFRIENVDVLDAIGIPHEGGQRFDFEYVSFGRLVTQAKTGMPAQRLMDLARRYSEKEAVARNPVESHLVNTAQQLNTYYKLHQQLQLLSEPFALEGTELQARLGGPRVYLTAFLEKGPQFMALLREYKDKSGDPAIGNAMKVASLLQEIAGNDGGLPALFPPSGTVAESEKWLGIGGLVEKGLFGELPPAQLEMIQHLQKGVVAADQAGRERELVAFKDAVVLRATERGEYGKIALETYYLEAAWHYRALHYFLLAMFVVAIGWLMPRSKWLWRAGIVATTVPLLFLITDIVLRCVIRGRPPILNLYDTFLFITAVGVTAAVVTEIVTKRRFAISLAPIFGALLITLARAFEVEDGKDQMAPLQAVLDTNYYLATHVTSINTGYAAGMFASMMGTAWLLMQAFGFRRNDVVFHKSIVRATYGLVAFGLIFAVFGTIYGGVWANDSWGRFWGWDPKENGALLICLAQVALMHARMCGWVRDFGFCVGAALTGIVVAFSWFHVNLLGIGLHSYGFASSTKTALFTYYGVQLVLVAVGVIGVLVRRAVVPAVAPEPATVK